MKSWVIYLFLSILTLVSGKCLGESRFSFYALDANPAGFKEGSEVKGYYADILRRISESLGQEQARIVLAPYSRIVHALNVNSSGFVVTCLFSNHNLNNAKVVQPHLVAHFKTGVVSLDGAPFTWENARGKRVATVLGASRVYGDKFHRRVHSGEIQLVSVTDYDHAIRMLMAGRIDGFAGNLAPILHYVKANSLPYAPPAVIAEVTSYLTISAPVDTPDRQATIDRVVRIVKNMWDSGEIGSILNYYVPDPA